MGDEAVCCWFCPVFIRFAPPELLDLDVGREARGFQKLLDGRDAFVAERALHEVGGWGAGGARVHIFVLGRLLARFRLGCSPWQYHGSPALNLSGDEALLSRRGGGGRGHQAQQAGLGRLRAGGPGDGCGAIEERGHARCRTGLRRAQQLRRARAAWLCTAETHSVQVGGGEARVLGEVAGWLRPARRSGIHRHFCFIYE